MVRQIVMDLGQMPEMDGLSATAAIRSAEDGGRRRPIVALTAAAMSGDEQRCLTAGMDGYIAKPVQISALRQALAKWTSIKGQ